MGAWTGGPGVLHGILGGRGGVGECANVREAEVAAVRVLGVRASDAQRHCAHVPSERGVGVFQRFSWS